MTQPTEEEHLKAKKSIMAQIAHSVYQLTQTKLDFEKEFLIETIRLNREFLGHIEFVYLQKKEMEKSSTAFS